MLYIYGNVSVGRRDVLFSVYRSGAVAQFGVLFLSPYSSSFWKCEKNDTIPGAGGAVVWLNEKETWEISVLHFN